MKTNLLPSLLLLLAAACNGEVHPDSPALTEQQTAALAAKYVGAYVGSSNSGGFSSLDLRADKSYVAIRIAAPTSAATSAPIGRPESGTWRAFHGEGGDHLVLDHEGTTETYAASLGAGTLSLTSPDGSRATYSSGSGKSCTADSQCATSEVCEPSPCLMACAPGDLTCCGGGRCVAKKPSSASCTVDSDCPSGTVCSTPPCLLVCTEQDPECCGPRACIPGSR